MGGRRHEADMPRGDDGGDALLVRRVVSVWRESSVLMLCDVPKSVNKLQFSYEFFSLRDSIAASVFGGSIDVVSS